MIHSWRWFGPNDPITLADIRQTGATGIVTALHELPVGAVWSDTAIAERNDMIKDAGLTWEVVESIPLPEVIKAGQTGWQEATQVWADNMQRLGRAGIRTICYNFMPVLDWTRTDLNYRHRDGTSALRFDFSAFSAFDLHILQRRDANQDYTSAQLEAAHRYFASMSTDDVENLTRTILFGLPGSEESYSLEGFRDRLKMYHGIDAIQMRAHLGAFLDKVLPVAEAEGMVLALHPDDPPRCLFGLPRIVSTIDDLKRIVDRNPHPANGLTLCTGSLGSRVDNDIENITKEMVKHINFAHLRVVRHEPDGFGFCEDHHLTGSFEMTRVISLLLAEEKRRGHPIPMRPDHGVQMLGDFTRNTAPGYPLVGRLRGLSELRGIEHAVRYFGV